MVTVWAVLHIRNYLDEGWRVSETMFVPVAVVVTPPQVFRHSYDLVNFWTITLRLS